MNVVEAYYYDLIESADGVLCTPKNLIQNKHFKLLRTPRDLEDEGVRMNHCLLDVHKVRYYIYEICRGNWFVYHIHYNGHASVTVDSKCKIIEIEGDKAACEYGKEVIKPYTNKSPSNSPAIDCRYLKDAGKWRRYEFVGVREDKPYQVDRSVLHHDTDIIITKRDQEHNRYFKVARLHYITDDTALSDYSFGSEEDCFKMYTFNGDKIHINDVTSEESVTFDVLGSPIK